MSGLMRLNLQEFRNVPLIPASAVYTVGGNSYVLVIDNIKDNVGVTRRLTVRPLLNDGRMARVAVVVREGEPLRGIPEETRELSPDEVLVLSRQTEIGSDQRVRVALKDW